MTAAEALAWVGSATAALLAALAVWQKIVRPTGSRVRGLLGKAERAFDVVLGTPAVLDPDRPGHELRPAMPDIGVRMSAIEDRMTDEALLTAQAALKTAEAASTTASTALEAVTSLKGEVHELGQKIERWQGYDRARGDVATSVLHEVGMAAGQALAKPPEGDLS